MARPHADDAHPVEWQLSALLDDELHDDEARVVALHVAGCPSCELALNRLGDTRDALRALPELAVPEHVLAGLPSATEVGRAVARRRAVRTGAGVLSVAGAAVGLWVLGADAEPRGPRGDVVPPVGQFVEWHADRDGTTVVPVGRTP